jgi:hypothetical protein
MRMEEVFNLKWMDIDLNNDLIHIKDTKSGVSRHADITLPLRDMFIRLEVAILPTCKKTQLKS